MLSRWKQFRHRLERLGVEALARGIPRLSRRRCVRLANALGEIAYRLDGRGRAVALANLECAFGARLTAEQRRELARASYRNFLRTMLDLFWARNLTPENYREFMLVEGFEETRAQLEREGRGTIFMCVHQGNWEWASLACGFLGFGNVVVAENFKNPLLTEIFCTLRQHSGQTIIPQENSLLRMLKIVKRRGATGMLIDLSLRPNQAATVIEAFAAKPSPRLLMCVPLIHAVLAERADALLVPVETQPQPDGTCRIIAHPGVAVPAGARHREIAQRCWEAFEPMVRARPDLWLWPYKHFRYRPRGATREYPFYANEAGKFEKLLRAQPGDAKGGL
ncbi:MAG: Kdo2-lipid lauroyltransferase/acyltransferase [Chthoniobacter sp.]|nr:Kdo2-lipid lauroyltransferase/acyltransferase [Chthoniobacter sp.]